MKDKRKKGKRIKISLSGKVIIIIIAFMFFCSALWTLVMFVNMARNANDNILNDEQSYMKTVETHAESVEEVCNLSKQMVSQMNPILNYIKMTQQGKDYSSVEKINFYNNEIEIINNMINANPYLYQVRLFVNSDITEKKPFFYSIDRMNNMSWGKNFENNQWQIGYADSVFPKSNNKNIQLAGIISKIEDEDGNLLAVLEVSTKIENLFGGFYRESEDEYCCFISNDQKIICENDEKTIWDDNKDDILQYIAKDENQNTSVIEKFGKNRCVISTIEMSALNGTFVHVRNIDSTIQSYYNSQIPYVMVVLISIVFFIIIVIILIRNIFKRFNFLTSDVSRIRNGEKIKISEQGDDEISELGKQINEMIDSLEKLNQENTNRQLLIKNAEIKSLQNQINAHFMYNVLETIKMMAEIKEDYEISDAITSLGQLFRYSMKWNSGLVTIKEEIKYIKNYLDLLNLRFDYEIYLSLNIPLEFMELKIPKMSLQPLVENSVYHGIENVAEDTSIYIKIFEKDGIVYIEVSDAGVGMDEEKLKEINDKLNSTEPVGDQQEHGRALYNVQQRIKMHFGAEYGLTVYSKKGMYTKVLIKIPYNEEKA
jgi:two-component system sensor histidine kinase YesM